MRVDVVILGGGEGAVVDPACRFKGLATIADRPMVEWVVEAMRGASLVEGIAVVVPTAEELGSWADRVDKLVISDAPFIDNIIAGIDAFRVDRPVLIATGDLPLLTPEAIDAFVRASLATGADFAYPIIPREVIEMELPGSKRTYVRLRSGEVTGGNMMIVNPALVALNRNLGNRLFETRKNPRAMAKILGLRFVAKLALGRLGVDEVEAKMAEISGGTAAAVTVAHASIGADVDKPEDVRLAERYLRARSEE